MEVAGHFRQHPEISWSEIFHIGEKIMEWKVREGVGDLVNQPAKMVTATLDDAIGQGLKMIHLFSCIMGIDIIPLGLMQSEERIVAECVKHQPDFLGLTILQFDTEDALDTLIREIPMDIKVIVGGPVFRFMDQDDLKHKPYIVLNTVSAFIDFFCNGM